MDQGIKRRRAAVIGAFGEGADFTTGQAVKCFELVRWLRGRYGEDSICTVNSFRWKRRPLRLFAAVVRAFASWERVILMPASHGIKVFGPMAFCLKKLFHRPVHYVVIGGWLADMLAGRPVLRRCVASFDGVYAETRTMVRALEDLGLKNVFCMPNFRKLEWTAPYKAPAVPPLRVCTYSRVTREKGLEDAADIVRMANTQAGVVCFQLDIYGRIDGDYRAEFDRLLEKNRDFVRYCGVKSAGEGVKTLAPYFALLFPTYYEGEGMAGTVLDAFASGTPVIANDWKYIRELVSHGENGLIYPFRDREAAARELCLLYCDEALYRRLQAGCRHSARLYDTQAVLGRFARQVFGEQED